MEHTWESLHIIAGAGDTSHWTHSRGTPMRDYHEKIFHYVVTNIQKKYRFPREKFRAFRDFQCPRSALPPPRQDGIRVLLL